MKNLFKSIVLLFMVGLVSVLNAQTPFSVEIAPKNAQDLRVTLDINGNEKKLILKKKNANGQCDPWQKFLFEYIRKDFDEMQVLSISTTDKDGKKVYLVPNGNISFSEQRPAAGWKILDYQGLKIASEGRLACMHFLSAQAETVLGFSQCDKIMGNHFSSDPQWNESLNFQFFLK